MALIDDSPNRADRGTGKRLDSWKAIAAHLGRDVRTVQRWEKQAQLPVHRLKHESRSTVFAWTGELDRWMAGRSESRPTPSRRLRYWTAGLAVAALLAAVALSRRLPRQVQPLDVRPLTSKIGLFWSPRLSPDGRYLVYVRRTTGSADLLLREMANGKEVSLHQTAAHEYSPVWSPDGSALAFLREASATESDLVVMSMHDRTERRIARVAAPRFGYPHLTPPHLDWSPDGSFLVVPERASKHAPYRLALIDVKTANKRYLTDPPVEVWGDTSARFSPDGKQLLIGRHTNAVIRTLILRDFDPARGLVGEPRRISTAEGKSSQDPGWTPDSRYLLFTSGQDSRLWFVSAESLGVPGRLPYSNPNVRMPDIRRTADGRWAMTFVQNDHDVEILRIPLRREGLTPRAAPVGDWTAVASSIAIDSRPALSPDGRRMAFISDRSGSRQIWIVDLASGQTVQLTRLPPCPLGHMNWSPDGSRIAFTITTAAAQARDLYTVNVQDGRVAPLVKRDSDDKWEWWSLDGKFLYFVGGPEGRGKIWRVPAEGGVPSVIYDRTFDAFREKPGGGYILVGDGVWMLPRSLEDEPEQLTARVPYDSTSFDVTTSGVYLVTAERELLHYGFSTGKLTTVAELPRPVRAGVVVSRDEKYAFVCLAEERLRIMLADDVRQAFEQ